MSKLVIGPRIFNPPVSSVLLTNENIDSAVGDLFHTSIGDVSRVNLINFCKTVDEIEFVDIPEQYDNNDYNDTKFIITYLSSRVPVTGFNRPLPNRYLDLDVSGVNNRALWVFGCSFSHGVGVEPNECYTSIVGKQLNLPVVSITKPGSSTRWSLRHLINADIKSDDLVVWQITTMERFSIANRSDQLTEVLLKHSAKNFINNAHDDQMFADQLSLLNYGVQYLRARSQRFCIVSLDSLNPFYQELHDQYILYPEYIYMPGWQTDLGSDQQHPGKLSHKTVAKYIADRLYSTL